MEQYQIEQRIQIDLAHTGVPPQVYAKQYDSNMRVVAVDLYNSGQPFTPPTGYAVNIRMDKRDGHHIYNPALFGTGNTVFVLLTQQMLTHPGTLLAELEVVQGGNSLKTATFVIACAPSAFPDDEIQSTDEYKTIQEIYEAVKGAVDILEDHQEEIDAIPGQIEDIRELVGRAETAEGNAASSASAAQESASSAAGAAGEAASSASSAADSRDKAKRYAEMASQVVTGSKGWFATPEELEEQYPTGEDGWWAIVGTTDTIWVWDSDTKEWKDSGRGSGGVTVDGTASGTTYDNTDSGLAAENVQEAIDELSKRESGGGNVYMEGGLDIKIKGDYPLPEEGGRNTLEIDLDDDSDPPPDDGDDSDLKEKLDEMQKKLESIQIKLNATLYVPGAGAHNSIYRGKYIGDVYTEDQKMMVAEDTFDDLYIGDFWIINNIPFRIGGFNYIYNCGDTPCKTPHMIIVPDESLYTHVMNDTNTTAGGYYGSKMHTSGLDKAKEISAAAFGAEHILSHREYLINAVTNGLPSGGGWYDCTVELMNERMVYGNDPFTPVGDGTSVTNNNTISKGQLPLFFFRHDLICIRTSWWLRDVITNVYFARVSDSGSCLYDNSSRVYGVRPAIPVC